MIFFHKIFAPLIRPFQSFFNSLFPGNEIQIVSLDQLKHIRFQLKQALFQKNQSPLIAISDDEKQVISSIERKTKEANLNNITRTNAYLSFFNRCSEVHWAFLAHIVSRNGGWNMTDLKGSLLSNILSEEQVKPLFLFLERANALIFHDAYPQLLLYEESKSRKQNLFHLLPHFSVSSFMKPLWDNFYVTREPALLTVALIINEQQYIQKHVIEQRYFQENVLETLSFLMQQWFGFTNVLIPYESNKKIRLAGATVRDFADVFERIQIGKTLYGILFQNKLFADTYKFLIKQPHTASRADFWPHLFTKERAKQNSFIYSPQLEQVWPNVSHRFPVHDDWFVDDSFANLLQTIPLPKNCDLTEHYLTNLSELSALSLSKKLFF